MWANSEKDYPAGTEAIYQCTNRSSRGFEMRVFEDK
jgi:hypothetical protein